MTKVSVVTVCYNAKNVIEDTICSVLKQDYGCIEYVLVDGDSKDGTLEILNNYKNTVTNYLNIEWKQISEPDNGIYDAMNKGVEIATGEWIIFMNAGDRFADYTTVSNVLDHNLTGYDGVFGDTIRVKGSKQIYVVGKELKKIKSDIPLPFCHQSVFVRKMHLLTHPFDLKYKQAGDYYFFCQLYVNGCKFLHVDIPISFYSMGGISEKNNILHLEEKIDIREVTGLEHYSVLKRFCLLNRLRIHRILKKYIPEEIFDRIKGFK